MVFLQTTYELCFEAYFVSADEYFESLIFLTNIQILKPIDEPYIRVYAWFKDEKLL
jgi:hypothetical protein